MLTQENFPDFQKAVKEKCPSIINLEYSENSDILTIHVPIDTSGLLTKTFYLLVDYGYFEARYEYFDKVVKYSRMFKGNKEPWPDVVKDDNPSIPYPDDLEEVLLVCDEFGEWPCWVEFIYSQKHPY